MGVPEDREDAAGPRGWLRLAAAAAALAATALPARAADDRGFKIGEAGRLTLRLELVGSYDSNVFYSDAGAAVGGSVVDVIPGLEMQVAGNTVSAQLKGGVDFKQYVTKQAQDLSRVFGNAALGASVNKDGMVGLELSDAFSRSDQTASLSVAQAIIANYNDLRLAVPMRPGGGALTLTLAGEWVREAFETYVTASGCVTTANPTCGGPLAPGIGAFGYNEYGGTVEVGWKFLPRTALVLGANYFQRTPDDLAVSLKVRGLRVSGGLAGLVTTHLAVTLKGGYGTAFDSPGFDYSTWLGNLELQWVTQGPLGAKIGYLHDFRADPGTSYAVYALSRAYLEGRAVLAGQLTVRGTLGWESLDYVINHVTGSVVSFSPALDYEIVRWASVGASYTLTSRTSGGLTGPVPAFDYTRHLIALRAVFTY